MIDNGENDPILSSSSTFKVTVNDWECVYITSTGESQGTVRI